MTLIMIICFIKFNVTSSGFNTFCMREKRYLYLFQIILMLSFPHCCFLDLILYTKVLRKQNSVIRSLSLSLSCVWFCMYTSDDLYIVYTCMFTLCIFIFWHQIIWFEGINWTLTWYIIFCKKNNLKKENHKILEILTFTGWSLQSITYRL